MTDKAEKKIAAALKKTAHVKTAKVQVTPQKLAKILKKANGESNQ